MSHAERFDRNIRLFGSDGQAKLRGSKVVIAGVGGLGSALAQQLALLGVGTIVLIDNEELDETNRNRFVGARIADVVPGSAKVDIVARMIREIDPAICVDVLHRGVVDAVSFAAVKDCDVVFGCFDHDGPRHVLNQLSAVYDRLYIDLASDVPSSDAYGGRVCVCGVGACLSCMGVLDARQVQQYFETRQQREDREAIYGVDKEALGLKGPSVAPLNGVVASLGALEFMASTTGLRAPRTHLNYAAHLQRITYPANVSDDCYVCKCLRGSGNPGEVEHFLRAV